MAVSTATVHSVQTLKSDHAPVYDSSGNALCVQVAEILFTIPTTQTYAQANNGILTGVAALISASRRNGKTPTLLGCAVSQCASKASNPAAILGLKTVAISTADITFEVTDGDFTTEYADATAMVAQSRPFGIVVSFTE